jgi:hypothetical protein
MKGRDLPVLQFESVALASGTTKDRGAVEC